MAKNAEKFAFALTKCRAGFASVRKLPNHEELPNNVGLFQKRSIADPQKKFPPTGEGGSYKECLKFV